MLARSSRDRGILRKRNFRTPVALRSMPDEQVLALGRKSSTRTTEQFEVFALTRMWCGTGLEVPEKKESEVQGRSYKDPADPPTSLFSSLGLTPPPLQPGEEPVGRDMAASGQELTGTPLVEDEEARESDRDSAVGSAAGSELSDGGRGGEKEEGLRLLLPGDKAGECSINPSVTSDLSTRSSASLNEEQFEDYGEGEDKDYNPSSPGDEAHGNAFSDLSSSVSSRFFVPVNQQLGPVVIPWPWNMGRNAGQTPRKTRPVNVDLFCSQCCKKVTQLHELETRLKSLKTHRQLLQHSNLSSSNGSTEDLFRDSIDSCDTDISEKVSQLEKKLCELENECLMNGDVKSKLKQENTQLVHRVHELEEQLKEQEVRAEQSMEEELRRHREVFTKLERDKDAQIELLTNRHCCLWNSHARVQQLEMENAEMLSNMNRLKSQTEKLDEEKQRMTDKLEDTSLRLKDEMDLYRKMMDKLRQNRHDYQTEREAMQELIEDLRRELEHLQVFKLEAERVGRGRSSSTSPSEFSTRTRESELEQEVKRLKQENQKLREQNEELNGQILSLSLHEAKNLFAAQTKAQSLASEIDNASRDQVLRRLKSMLSCVLCASRREVEGQSTMPQALSKCGGRLRFASVPSLVTDGQAETVRIPNNTRRFKCHNKRWAKQEFRPVASTARQGAPGGDEDWEKEIEEFSRRVQKGEMSGQTFYDPEDELNAAVRAVTLFDVASAPSPTQEHYSPSTHHVPPVKIGSRKFTSRNRLKPASSPVQTHYSSQQQLKEGVLDGPYVYG
ncbi:hypothetical protein P4O66_000622 [Electrophorus voltai]|uniref:Rab11-FIP3/4 domain-containing protein n=1 Tax=Electrophorus voltai TaxID=2609070 RepID=A0AAD8ZFJ5_9TELE|nr:hypothetical protein P4O66_000622 [Electrophorus voltai]